MFPSHDPEGARAAAKNIEDIALSQEQQELTAEQQETERRRQTNIDADTALKQSQTDLNDITYDKVEEEIRLIQEQVKTQEQQTLFTEEQIELLGITQAEAQRAHDYARSMEETERQRATEEVMMIIDQAKKVRADTRNSWDQAQWYRWMKDAMGISEENKPGAAQLFQLKTLSQLLGTISN